MSETLDARVEKLRTLLEQVTQLKTNMMNDGTGQLYAQWEVDEQRLASLARNLMPLLLAERKADKAALAAAYTEITDIERCGQHADNPLPTMLREALALGEAE